MTAAIDYNHASVEANAAFEAVMTPARELYDAEIALAKSLGRDGQISREALAAWTDAYNRAGAARAQVLARYGFTPTGEPLPKEPRRAA